MFDGILLHRLLNEFNTLKTGRISKITSSFDSDVLLTIRANRTNYTLMISTSNYARIHLTNKQYDTNSNPKSFIMLLRKHIEGYMITDINTYNSDRVIYFTLMGYNEIEDYKKKYLICEIMGRYSNIILTDDEYKIIDAIKHDGIGEYNRTILPNALYEFPKNDKLDTLSLSLEQIQEIFNTRKMDNPKELMDVFNGISMNFASLVFKTNDTYNNFIKILNAENKPSIYLNINNKEDFYYNPFDYKKIKEFDSLSAMLDEYYYDADLKAKIKLKTNDLSTFINKQIKKYESKVLKLEKELLDNNTYDEYKLCGELLLSYPNLKAKLDNIDVFNYYTNENMNIKLDKKYTVLENSNKFYKKYQKSKSSISYINEQIEIAKKEIEYFTLLSYQITDATFNEALEIQDELIQNKYIFNKEITNNKKKAKIKLLTFELDNCIIKVGKNNIQNEALTHHLSGPNDLWFHVKDSSGAHVVASGVEITEAVIRACANLASYYSTFKDSSSVAVDYTLIRNIKKIPGRKACFVTYKNQKTIYIDPSYDDITKLKVIK